MVVPEEREGKSKIASELLRDSSKPSDVISSRKGGGKENQITRKVITTDAFNTVNLFLAKVYCSIPFYALSFCAVPWYAFL